METSPRVVLVEDDEDIRVVAEKALRGSGYEVFSACDGESGLQLVKEKRPQVVILDLMMPRMHGFTVCQAMRSDPSLRHIAILVTSAKSYAVDVARAHELGADYYLTKPYDVQVLLQTVKTLAGDRSQLLVKFWGTRGSLPTPGAATLRYGGNTACVEVRDGDTIIMLDCGSGAREMGAALGKEFKGRRLHVHLFVSHTHWDHIQGFPFFMPAYCDENHVDVFSLRGSGRDLKEIFTGQMDASYFPVSLKDMKSDLNFVELDGRVKVGRAEVSHLFLNHPGVAVGFRIEVDGKCLVYITDHEVYTRMSGEHEQHKKLDRQLNEFAHKADLYIRDAQYTEEEYASRQGWGHSTWKDALESAHEAGVTQLALFHHDPGHDDAMMDAIMCSAREYMNQRGMHFKCFAAADNTLVRI
jgi:CheY-like chemotaxis protein/phosphoribosyl 1,2-cyclic phosphodiesterase